MGSLRLNSTIKLKHGTLNMDSLDLDSEHGIS